MPAEEIALISHMIKEALVPLKNDAPFDFGATDLAERMRDAGLAFAERRAVSHLPPTETLFIQRKFGGLYLLAARLRARVDVRAVAARYLDADEVSR